MPLRIMDRASIAATSTLAHYQTFLGPKALAIFPLGPGIEGALSMYSMRRQICRCMLTHIIADFGS
jgi:hypothetical protein